MRFGGVPVQTFRDAVFLQRCIVVLLLFANLAKADMRASFGRVEIDRLAKFLFRTLKVRGSEERAAQTLVAHGEIGCDGFQLAKLCDGLGVHVSINQRLSEVLPSPEHLWIQTLGLTIFTNRGIEITFFAVYDRQIVVRPLICRIESDRFLVFCNGLVPIFSGSKQYSQIIVH